MERRNGCEGVGRARVIKREKKPREDGKRRKGKRMRRDNVMGEASLAGGHMG